MRDLNQIVTLLDPYWMKDLQLLFPLDDPDVWWYFFTVDTPAVLW